MATDDEKFIEEYKKFFETLDHQKMGGQVIVDAAWNSPRHLVPGYSWVMYLPLDITEGLDMVPRMARVQSVRLERGSYTIVTELGVMVIPEHEKVQVVV